MEWSFAPTLVICPRGENSWWKYQKYLVTGQPTYKTIINRPGVVCDVIKPIVLLGKRLQCIWKNAPKETFEKLWKLL